MKKKKWCLLFFIIVFAYVWYLTKHTNEVELQNTGNHTKQNDEIIVQASTKRTQLEDGFTVMRYDETYGFQNFLDQGGASSDEEVLQYIMEHVVDDVHGLHFINDLFGCSTIQTRNSKGEVLFGRNFDWETSEALILQANPDDAYASIATVNLDFIQSGTSIPLDQLPDDVLAKVAMYAPLDGMNEKGLAVSVNMIQDGDVIAQNGKNQNLTTTTAIRLLLNKAANVEEAIALLQEYNLHSSLGMMIHYAIVDAAGNHVVVEYVNNEMHVIETPVVTNFYLSPGEKQNIGSAESHERYRLLMEQLEQKETMDMLQVKDALDRVSKDNFTQNASTEWSIVYNLQTLEVHYYHRENYDKRFVFNIQE